MKTRIEEREFQEEVISSSGNTRRLPIIRVISWILLAGSIPRLATLTYSMAPNESFQDFLAKPEVQSVLLSSGLFVITALLAFGILRSVQNSPAAGMVMAAGILTAIFLTDILLTSGP